MAKDPTLLLRLKEFYFLFGFNISEFEIENERNAYKACQFLLNEKIVIYREAKITPKKVGQFVAVWKRNEQGITSPYHVNDNFDLIIISVKTQTNFGQFIFPKSVLLKKAIISSTKIEGKRGFRLYPKWDVVLSKQAINTQQWQANYFLDCSNFNDINFNKWSDVLNIKS